VHLGFLPRRTVRVSKFVICEGFIPVFAGMTSARVSALNSIRLPSPHHQLRAHRHLGE
jgi:hypothetical protein